MAVVTAPLHAKRDGIPADVARRLGEYNEVWHTMSTTGSMESMPLGNGDLTANVWVERGGDLMIYLGKSDTWSEGTRLLKLGRLRISLDPNPFLSDEQYTMELDLLRGEIRITASDGHRVTLHLWADANRPVLHVTASSARPVTLRCCAELMRKHPFTLQGGNDPLASSFRGVTDGPVAPSESADQRLRRTDGIGWVHRNRTSLYPLILQRENVGCLTEKYPDPYLNRTFGALVKGTGMRVESDSLLVSIRPAREQELTVTALTEQTATAAEWESHLEETAARAEQTGTATAYREHRKWWETFWNRSWVFLTGNEEAREVTRAYILQRYLIACQSRGNYPVKFNGGTLTFDYDGQDADFRRWGPGYWFQNCRLYYWPLAASGDFDLKQPWFDLYMHMLPLQRDVTRLLYGHGGAFFPETFNFFGLYILDDWGWDNPGKASQTRWIRYHYSGALEMLAEMIDCYRYTDDEAFARNYVIPFATEVIRFFDCHWPRINRQLRFIPANATEQYWDCLNPADYIAGLTHDIRSLLEFPEGVVPEELLTEWRECLAALPPLPRSKDGKRLLPAEEYGEGRNFENPECYSIFPFPLFGLGREELELARETFRQRIFKGTNCWSQCPIQAALLGLPDEAREQLLRKVRAVEPGVRFPAFWKPGSDYVPDLDNGGAMAMAVQAMLLQQAGDSLLIAPALPEGWDADFKLWAHGRRTVHAVTSGGKVVKQEIEHINPKIRN